MNIANFKDIVQMLGTGTPSGGALSSRPSQLQQYLPQSIQYASNVIGGITTWHDSLRTLAGGTPLANPTTAPTFSGASTTGGSLVGGSVLFASYSYKNANGETLQSAEGTYTVPAGTSTNTVNVVAPALPGGATGINVYVSATTGGEMFSGTSASNSYTLGGLPPSPNQPPSPWNTTSLTTEQLNLTNGSLLSSENEAITFKAISCIHVENPSITSPMVVFGGGTFAGPLSIASTALFIPPAITLANGQVVNTCCHLPAYWLGGSWKVQNGVNNLLRIGTYDPAGVSYGIVLPGVI